MKRLLDDRDRFALTVAILEAYLDDLISAQQARLLATKLGLRGFLPENSRRTDEG